MLRWIAALLICCAVFYAQVVFRPPGGGGAPVGGAVSGTWGSIAGTLSDQIDLQAALDAKAATDSTAQLLTVTDSAVDIGNVNDGACSAAEAVALTGAALGDSVTVIPTTAVLVDAVYVHARVSGADTVRYYVCNLSGAAFNPASADYRVQILKAF